jgi:hypothetical protein
LLCPDFSLVAGVPVFVLLPCCAEGSELIVRPAEADCDLMYMAVQRDVERKVGRGALFVLLKMNVWQGARKSSIAREPALPELPAASNHSSLSIEE